MGAEMVAFLESVLSGLDCLDCLAEKGENPKVSGRAVSTSVDVFTDYRLSVFFPGTVPFQV